MAKFVDFLRLAVELVLIDFVVDNFIDLFELLLNRKIIIRLKILPLENRDQSKICTRAPNMIWVKEVHIQGRHPRVDLSDSMSVDGKRLPLVDIENEDLTGRVSNQ